MARIAALVVPPGREAWLKDALVACGRAMGGADTPVESAIHGTRGAVCGMVRVGTDVLDPVREAGEIGEPAVLCGYLLPAGLAAANQAHGPGLVSGAFDEELDRRLRRLDGVFAFATWDARRERLHVAVDKLGMRPLFWTRLSGGGYAIASEIKGLVAVLDTLRVNWAAWEEQLAFGYQFGDHTVFEGIMRVAPAERLVFTAESLVRHRYESPVDEVEPAALRPEEYLEANQAAFDAAMQRCEQITPAGVPRMLTLSGGFDSRRIFGWLVRRGIPFESFSVPGIREDGYEYEASIARRLCAAFNVPWHFIDPVEQGDPDYFLRARDILTDFESDEHLYAAFLSLSEAGRGRINYDGLAGDVFVNGWFIAPEYARPGGMELFRAAIRRQAASVQWLPRTDVPLPVRIEEYLATLGDSPNAITRFYLRSRTRREVGLAPAGMQVRSFESLYPYLDREVIAASMAVPSDVRASREMQTRLMERELPSLMAFPVARTATPQDGDRVPAYGTWCRKAEWVQLQAAVSALGRFGEALNLDLPARLRIFYGLLLAPLLPERHRGWQLYKAGFIRRFAEFLEASASPSAYLKLTRAALYPSVAAPGAEVVRGLVGSPAGTGREQAMAGTRAGR